jgi:prolyl 4-hydroxylase
MWDAPPTIFFVNKEEFGGSLELQNKIFQKSRVLMEEWTGQQLSPVSLYGVRVYHNGSILAPHVDRAPLVISAIINVDQDVDETWPLEVYDHFGTAHNITMEPGDMVLYESHSVIHGRPFPLKGKFYANIFIHFEPTGPLNDGGDERGLLGDLPPYLIPGSYWESKWRKQNPKGWQDVSLST